MAGLEGSATPQQPLLTHLSHTRTRIDSLVAEMRATNRRLNGSHPEPASGPSPNSKQQDICAADLMRETDYLLDELERATKAVVGSIGLQQHELPQATPQPAYSR